MQLWERSMPLRHPDDPWQNKVATTYRYTQGRSSLKGWGGRPCPSPRRAGTKRPAGGPAEHCPWTQHWTKISGAAGWHTAHPRLQRTHHRRPRGQTSCRCHRHCRYYPPWQTLTALPRFRPETKSWRAWASIKEWATELQNGNCNDVRSQSCVWLF